MLSPCQTDLCAERLPNLLCRGSNPTDASASSAVMKVDEDENTVTVQAGVVQRDLLDYLANYS